jgi:hypothetical protein
MYLKLKCTHFNIFPCLLEGCFGDLFRYLNQELSEDNIARREVWPRKEAKV